MKSIVKDLSIDKNSNMKLRYNIIALVFVSLFAVSCGKKEATEEKAPEKTEQKEQHMKKDHKLLPL
jgi:hypothetical protein